MNDWEEFVEYAPWFLKPNAEVRVSEPRNGIKLSPSANEIFPSLSKLLAQSSVTPVSINNIFFELLTWNTSNGNRIGWLYYPGAQSLPDSIHSDHRKLLSSFGGVVERLNEPEDTWLLNHNDVLTSPEASRDISFIRDYSWAFDDLGIDFPIRVSDFYSIAQEANGNTTICNRMTGKVILFAPDHAFDFVEPYENSPEYTLYKLNGVVVFCDWVETVAKQWLKYVD